MSVFTKEHVQRMYTLMRARDSQIPDDALDQMRDLLMLACRPLDYTLQKGDQVYAKNWSLNGGKVEIVDLNWHVSVLAAAVRLLPGNGIVVWPIAGLSKTSPSESSHQREEQLQSIATEQNQPALVTVTVNGQQRMVENIEFTTAAIRRLVRQSSRYGRSRSGGRGMTTKLHYQEVAASDLVRNFVKGYEFPDGTTLLHHDWFFDASKRIFVIKLVVEEPDIAAAQEAVPQTSAQVDAEGGAK